MNKKFCILDWQYWSIVGIIISFLFLIALYLINIKVFVISPAIFIFVVGLCIAIIHFYYNLENKIKRITINDDTISFDIIKNHKRKILNFNRKDLIACKMSIYTKYGIKIGLNFEIVSTDRNKFTDIYYEVATLSIIKQLFILKNYIDNFSYDVSDGDKQITNYVKAFIKRGLKYSLKDKIYNTIMTLAIIISWFYIFFYLFIKLNLFN